jgi:hypothetical protein
MILRAAAWLLLIAGTTACDLSRVKLRPVQMELYSLYDSACATNASGGFKRVYFDDFVLVISETNKFSLRETDIRDVALNSEDGNLHLSLILKKNRRGDFRAFTTANSNTYVAVMVNGKIRNIAKIREPVSNGRLQFVSAPAHAGELGRFIRLFVL